MSRLCKAQDFTEWAKSVKARVLQYPGWYGKSPMSVLADFSISSDAKVLFGILGAKTYKTPTKSNVISFSTREVAELFGVTAPTISNWLKELEDEKHIEKLSKTRARSVYRLLSPVFDYRVRVETGENAAAEVESKSLPMIRDKRRKCPKCKKVVRIASTSGVCDGCLSEWVARERIG